VPRDEPTTLEFTWNMNIGADGTDGDPENPLSRALDRLLRTGKPFERLTLCFCQLPDVQAGPAAVRWLGAFALSAGERLLFFPGFANPPEAAVGFRDADRMWRADRPIDHLSLERDTGRWHATTPRSRHHFGGPEALDLGEGRCLWFGFSVAAPEFLRPANKVTLAAADVPGVDAVRRTEVFRRAREAAAFPVVTPNPATRLDAPGYFHFSVVAGPPGFPDYTGTEHGFPRHAPYLGEPMPDRIDGLAVASFRTGLAPYCDLWVTVMRLPGRLTVPWLFTSPGALQTH
jgi:hypothetical protein